MVKLKSKARYRNDPLNLDIPEGGIVEVEEDLADHLQRDAPENFSIVKPRRKAPSKPTKDKAVKQPAVKK